MSKNRKKMRGGENPPDTITGYMKQSFNEIIQSFYDFYEKLITKSANNSEWQSCILKYIAMLIVVIGLSAYIISALSDPGNALRNIDKYFFVIALPVLLLFAFMLNLDKDSTARNTFYKIVGAFSIIAAGLYLYSMYGGGVNNILNNDYVKYILLTLIILNGLGIIYNKFIIGTLKTYGWYSFLLQLIFYLPCVLYDFWLSILDDFKLTSVSTYIILFIEVVFIILYFCMPYIVDRINGVDNAKQLLDSPVFLDKEEIIIANGESLAVNLYQDAISGIKNQFRNNYCISMWVYVNTQSSTSNAYNKETQIFSYGYTDEKGIEQVKPMIRYYGGGNSTDLLDERDKMVFYFSEYPPKSKDESSYDLTVPSQKWNNIVINYNRNVVDLYINGNLERSFYMQKVLPKYNEMDRITVGSFDGISGSICNVMFYNHPLSPSQIATGYNILMNSNPPISKKM
jgi:hypothetical protein